MGQQFSFSFLGLQYSLLEVNSRKIFQNLTNCIDRDGIHTIKFETARIYKLVDDFVAYWLPNIVVAY